MKNRTCLLVALWVAVGISGCESAAKKCMKTTDETYAREVAACKDEACKAKALKTKLEYYEICKNK